LKAITILFNTSGLFTITTLILIIIPYRWQQKYQTSFECTHLFAFLLSELIKKNYKKIILKRKIIFTSLLLVLLQPLHEHIAGSQMD
jgi:hypothetical protein